MVAITTHNTLTLADGRALGYAEFGARDGAPILFFHGVPGSRLSAIMAGVIGAGRNARVIALDRPGYGLSDTQPGRRIVDWPRDVAEATEALGLGRFAVFGFSGGGPYAAACAALLPERITGVAIASGMGPLTVPAARDALTRRQSAYRLMVRHAPVIVRRGFERYARALERDPDAFIRDRMEEMTEADRAILRRPEIRSVFHRDMAEAFRNGGGAAATDFRLLAGDWGFDLASITAPVHLWHGEDDTVVPAWLGRVVAGSIPGAHARFLPGEGHLLFLDHMDEIIEPLTDPDVTARHRDLVATTPAAPPANPTRPRRRPRTDQAA